MQIVMKKTTFEDLDKIALIFFIGFYSPSEIEPQIHPLNSFNSIGENKVSY